MAGSYAATEVRWQDRARCNGSEIDFTPEVESREELTQVRALFCDLCPVRTECFAYAVVYRAKGYWGGTSTQDRTLLGYSRNRVKCPVCLCKSLVRTESHEICQGCGVSWTRILSEGETT